MSGRLQDRVAIVTGAGDGIGEGVARRFAAEGARVLVAEIDGERGAAVAESLTRDFGAEAVAIRTDVAVRADVERMVERALEAWGAVDILVNNAWGGGALGRLEHKKESRFDAGFHVGFYGPLWAMQAAFPIDARPRLRTDHQHVFTQRRERAHRVPPSTTRRRRRSAR